MLESLVDRAFRNLIKHHAEGSFGWPFGNDFFRQMLANRFTFPVGVSGEIDVICAFGSGLQFRNNPLVVSFFGIGNYFIGGFEIIVDINAQTFGRQILNVAYRGLDQIVLSQILDNGLRLRRRFNYY